MRIIIYSINIFLLLMIISCEKYVPNNKNEIIIPDGVQMGLLQNDDKDLWFSINNNVMHYNYSIHNNSYDFNNFPYMFNKEIYVITNGCYSHDRDSWHFTIKVDDIIKYSEYNNDYAVVSFDIFSVGGSSIEYNIIEIYQLNKTNLESKCRLIFYGFSRNYHEDCNINIDTKEIIVNSRYLGKSRNICDTATFSFQGNKIEIKKCIREIKKPAQQAAGAVK